jgi:hypothetical protein
VGQNKLQTGLSPWGKVKSGIIPDYAMFPDGRLCDTAVFWKRLDPSS